MSRYSSRKFVAAMAALACSTWALFEHLIAASDYKAIVLGTVAAYIVGNVAQRAVEAKAPA
jgi:hypothetical protein